MRRDVFFCVHILLLLLYVRAASVVDDGAQHNRTRGCRVVDVCGFVAGRRGGCKVEMKEIDGNSIPAAIYYYRYMSINDHRRMHRVLWLQYIIFCVIQ